MQQGPSGDATERLVDAMTTRGDDAPMLSDLARAVLRRIEPGELDAIDPVALERWLVEVLDRLRTDVGDVRVSVEPSDAGLDGRRPGPVVVQVTTQDRPFLLATVTDELQRSQHDLVRVWHPIIGVTRDAHGAVASIVPARHAEQRICVIRVELGDDVDAAERARLAEQIDLRIRDVVRATDDHASMVARLEEIATELRFGAWSGQDDVDAGEAADLVDWLLEDNLIILGVRDYTVVDDRPQPAVQVVQGSGLGLLRDTSRSRFATPRAAEDLPADARRLFIDPQTLRVTRTRSPSTVQRREQMLHLAIARRDDAGTLVSTRILGLLTRKALIESVEGTPVVRRRLREILEREDLVDGSHDQLAVTALVQALPKDELLQMDVDELQEMVHTLLHTEQRGDVRTLLRREPTDTSVSVVVAVPRDRYGPQLRERLQEYLQARFHADHVDVDVSFGQRREAIARFLVHATDGLHHVSEHELAQELRRVARSWLDELDAALADDEHATAMIRLAHRLPPGYRDVIAIDDAVADVRLLHRVPEADDALVVEVRAPREATLGPRVRVAKRGPALELSAFMPLLESLGLLVLEEVPHRLQGGTVPLYLHDFGVRADGIDADRDGPRIAAAVLAAWRGHLAVDGLNELVVVAGLDWQQVAILRAYRRLRRQIGTTFTPDYVNTTLVGHPEIARALVEHFSARFDPARSDSEAATARQAVTGRCDALTRLDHDRILRGFVELIDATVRTNAFRPDATADGSGEPYVALKLDPSRIADTRPPIPHREVFVHSPRMEGVHLRYGAVARGGLRWSDRLDDVRTEVFDLVKAQVTKNALIVPTGAKGGFVLANEPEDPSALRDEIERQYVTFVRGLLDVTDNLAGGEVVPPAQVRAHDGPDPYLVVAADRGTATLSDTANSLARRYGHWLDDAFASGGSNGYDHKKLGVTARGAWLAVRRHFRELGVDVQSEPIDVVGVGDMSGDVFGNGMLQSRTIRLVAAFDHRDIFLDPEPDAGLAYEERARLFALPRSSWQDYDRTLISAGGGVFSRSARSIPLPPQIRTLLRVDEEELSPPALVRAILRAPVDLVFAGGIGTYVKASSERHEDVADRANDELRVDARDLRARVIGEGANLFITQRGRLEYARRGGHLNQDAIDNAGGVATSDAEVNLKILLTLAQDEGLLEVHDRDRVLDELSEPVVERVMQAVDRQAAALSRELPRSPRLLRDYDRMMDDLGRTHALDRDVEGLPGRDELDERIDAGAGLSRPELATLLAWSKRSLKEQLLDDGVLDEPLMQDALAEQFPAAAVERFAAVLPRHRLRRELIATALANDIVERMGITFVPTVAAAAGTSAATVVTAYRLATEVLGAPRLWSALEDLESSFDAQRIRDLEDEVGGVVAAVVTGLVHDPDVAADPVGVRTRVLQVREQLGDALIELGTAEQRRARAAHLAWLLDDLVEPDLARFLAVGRDLAVLPEVAVVVEALGGSHPAAEVLEAFLRVGESFGIDRLEDLLGRTRVAEPWSVRQRDGLAVELRHLRRDAALAALRSGGPGAAVEAVRTFAETRSVERRRIAALLGDIAGNGDSIPLDAVAVGARAISAAVGAARPAG